jgi:hypothetical protein
LRYADSAEQTSPYLARFQTADEKRFVTCCLSDGGVEEQELGEGK